MLKFFKIIKHPTEHRRFLQSIYFKKRFVKINIKEWKIILSNMIYKTISIINYRIHYNN